MNYCFPQFHYPKSCKTLLKHPYVVVEQVIDHGVDTGAKVQHFPIKILVRDMLKVAPNT